MERGNILKQEELKEIQRYEKEVLYMNLKSFFKIHNSNLFIVFLFNKMIKKILYIIK